MILASFGTTLIGIGIVTVSILLIGLILLQKNRGSGLSGAFGGVGGHSAFGTKTGDMLTWVTVGLAAVFLVLAIVGNFVFEIPATTGLTPGTPGGPQGGAPGTVMPTQVPPPGSPAGPQPGSQLPPGTTLTPMQGQPPAGAPVGVRPTGAPPPPAQAPAPTQLPPVPAPAQTPPAPAPIQTPPPAPAQPPAQGGSPATPAQQ
jgi:preprotein translocase subunit SecG